MTAIGTVNHLLFTRHTETSGMVTRLTTACGRTYRRQRGFPLSPKRTVRITDGSKGVNANRVQVVFHPEDADCKECLTALALQREADATAKAASQERSRQRRERLAAARQTSA